MQSNNFYVYITTNPSSTTLYIGMTNNLERRIQEHVYNSTLNNGSFTSKYNCTNLIYFEIYPDAKQAYLREKQIKKYSREKKEKLIDSMNPVRRILNEGF